MKKLIAYILALVASVALADPPAPFPIEINSQSRVAPEVWTFRNNVRTFRATFKDGTNEVSLVGATPFMSWSTNENASGVVTSSWALVNSGTNGIVDFTFTEAALNYATITNVYEIGVAGSVAVYNRGRFLIKPSPYSTGTNMPVFTTNQNLTGYSFSGQPWIENLTLTTGGAAYVWSGTGTTRNLNVPTNTGSSGSGSGITTNVKVGASSSTRLVVSNGASAEVTMVFDATGLSTGTPLYVESFTGSVGSLSGVATGTPLYVEAFTGSVGSLSGVATGSPLYVESFTGSVGSLSGVATGSPIYSIAGLATGSPLYVEAFTGSVGSLSGVATGSPIYSIAGLATGTPLYVEAFTGSVGSLSGVATGTPIYSVAGLATGTPLYLEQFTGSVGSVVGLATGTPLYVEADTAAIVRVTGLGVVVTNNAGAIITNFGHFTTLNGSAVSKTSTVEQVMVSSLQSYGTFSASTNLIAANTNIVGGEKLTNGTFTGSEANWSLTSSTYNANNVIVLPGATATITYTGTIASVKGKAYQVSWMSTPANGTDFTTYKVSLGGVTNNIGTCPTSTVTKLFGPLFTDQPLQFVVAPGTNQLILDTVSVKEDTDGDLIVADDASIGGRLVVAESISTTGSVTAASFSGTSTSFVEIAGDTMTGPLTNNVSVTVYAGADQYVKLAVTTNGGVASGSIIFMDDQSSVESKIWIQDAGAPKFTYSGTTGDLWTSVNDGIGSGLDAGLVEGVDMLTNGYLKVTVAATNPSAADGYALVKRGTNFSLEIPASASTGSVGGISHTGSVAGTIILSDSAEVNVDQTNDTFSWSIVSGSIASNKLAAAVWAHVAAKMGTTNATVTTAQIQSGAVTGPKIGMTNTPVAAGVLVLATVDGGTNLYLKADDTSGSLVELSNSVIAVGLAATNAANTSTNAFLPTALAVGAGGTCIVVRTGANLFSLVATSTPTTITFDSTWTTGHVGTCLIELTAGTNSIAFPTSVVHNVGRASSTNLQIQTTGVTELMFQKPIGSIWRVIQLTP